MGSNATRKWLMFLRAVIGSPLRYAALLLATFAIVACSPSDSGHDKLLVVCQ